MKLTITKEELKEELKKAQETFSLQTGEFELKIKSVDEVRKYKMQIDAYIITKNNTKIELPYISVQNEEDIIYEIAEAIYGQWDHEDNKWYNEEAMPEVTESVRLKIFETKTKHTKEKLELFYQEQFIIPPGEDGFLRNVYTVYKNGEWNAVFYRKEKIEAYWKQIANHRMKLTTRDGVSVLMVIKNNEAIALDIPQTELEEF